MLGSGGAVETPNRVPPQQIGKWGCRKIEKLKSAAKFAFCDSPRVVSERQLTNTWFFKRIDKHGGTCHHVVVSVTDTNKWIRVEGVLKEDLRREARVAMLEENPSLKALADPDNGTMTVFYFESGVATINSFTEEPKVITL